MFFPGVLFAMASSCCMRGEHGDKFYIVLAGAVGVWVRDESVKPSQEQDEDEDNEVHDDIDAGARGYIIVYQKTFRQTHE